MPSPDKEDKRKQSFSYLRYAGLGFEILACMLVCVGAGYLIDEWLAPSRPWFTLGFSLVGCAAVVFLMIRTLSK